MYQDVDLEALSLAPSPFEAQRLKPEEAEHQSARLKVDALTRPKFQGIFPQPLPRCRTAAGEASQDE